MADEEDQNQKIINEFRTNNGMVGGQFEGLPMILIHHKGAKTGIERVNPLTYRLVGNNFAIFASKGGAPTNPDWYYNLLANPHINVEVGTETIEVTARIAKGDERVEIWETQKRERPVFADYEKATSREVPVIVLERD